MKLFEDETLSCQQTNLFSNGKYGLSKSTYSRLYTSLTAFRVLAGNRNLSKNSIFAPLAGITFKYSLGVDKGAV